MDWLSARKTLEEGSNGIRPSRSMPGLDSESFMNTNTLIAWENTEKNSELIRFRRVSLYQTTMPSQTLSSSSGPSTNTKSKKRSLTDAETEDPTPSIPSSSSKKHKINGAVSATHDKKKRQKKKRRKHSIVIIDQNGSARVRDSKSKSGDDSALVVSDPVSPAATVKHINGEANARGKAKELSLRALSVQNNPERDVEEIVLDPKLKASCTRIPDLGCQLDRFLG